MLTMKKRDQRCLKNLETPANISHIASRTRIRKRTQNAPIFCFTICDVYLGCTKLGMQCEDSIGRMTRLC